MAVFFISLKNYVFFSKKRKKCGGSRRYRHPSGPAGLCPTPGQMARETRRLISTPLNQHFLLETTPNNGHNNKSNNNNETNFKKKSPKEKKGEKMDIRPSHFRKDFVLIKNDPRFFLALIGFYRFFLPSFT